MSNLKEQMRVGIIMGSDSDLYKTMIFSGRALTRLGLVSNVDFEERIVSAHRTTKFMMEYAEEAEDRGLEVIIAGAGGSAHLPGMTSSETLIPVLGVAVTDNPDVMNRALGSIIGLPEGTPVGAFQGKTGAYNAGLFAARILARHDSTLKAALVEYTDGMTSSVMVKSDQMLDLGATDYLDEHPELLI